MVLYITAVHMEGGSGHEHIAGVAWLNPEGPSSGRSDMATMVDWVRKNEGAARVVDGKTIVTVGVVEGARPYLRTHADRKWSDNLLALPRY